MGVYVVKGKGKGKGEVHPRTDHENPEGEKSYSCTLSLPSALDGVGCERHAPATLPQGKRPRTHQGTLGAGQDVCGKSCPVWDFFYCSVSRIRSPDLPGSSESLYRLSYPGPWSLYGN
jgi:hypothetical protein